GGVITLLGLPNGFMFGPLALTIVLTTCEVRLSTIPTELTNIAQLMIGWVLGSRFERRSLASAPRYVGAAVVSILAGILCAGVRSVARLGVGAVDRDAGARNSSRRHRRDVHHCQSAAARRALRDGSPRQPGLPADSQHWP